MSAPGASVVRRERLRGSWTGHRPTQIWGAIALVTDASRGVGAGSPANSANPNDVVGLYPEFTGTERVEAAFDGPEEIPDGTESTRYSGRAVAALAADSRVTDRSGDVFKSGELARDYGITDVDGARPEPFTFDATRLRGIRIKSRDGAVPYGLL